jgi:hypothetical protein
MLLRARSPLWLSLLVASVLADGSLSFAAAGESSPPPPPTRRSPTPRAQRPSGRMVGRYLCAQGWTDLELELRSTGANTVEAVFDFHFAPRGVRGRYSMRGTRSAAGQIDLVPVAWIERPENYIMVAMRGRIGADGVFRGRIQHPSCGEFVVAPSGR